MKTSQVITGILAGAAAGAILGVLYAPDKGSNTRKKIMQKGSDYKQSFKNQVNHLVDTVTSPFHTMRSETNGQAELAGTKRKEVQR
jgi:gas vesicle protein